MKGIGFLLVLVGAFVLISCDQKREGKPRVLVFSKYAGFHHLSIPAGVAAIQKLGAEHAFEVDTTQNANVFKEDSLKKYSAVIFLNTTGNVLDYRQEVAFERYIQAGGGFVGVHSATDTEYDWGWYSRLVGANFKSHPRPQKARFVIHEKDHPATSFFKDTVWQRTDELYNFKKLNPDIHVLITIDESSYEGGANGKFHPMSWYHEYDGGRAFYTAMGHTDESYTEPEYLNHLLGGIHYAIGDNLVLNYSKARSQYPPDEDRFTKTQLVQGGIFYEPTELTVLPNLDVLIVQRRGQVLLYKNETKTIRQVGFVPVYHQAAPGVNAEEGLMGLAKDPHYEKNNWIYLYYSPVDSSVNRLSRFTFKNDTLDLSTEKVILEVKSQRQICCHTGGSIAFGPDGLLFVSTGDNSTPFDEPKVKYVNSGYGPLNDLPGHTQYDARRSSGNTNDLRGKILRIRVKDDATYEIPDGNLFPVGTDKTRPEIYVMGNRNPYRISVDQKNSFLYWGEVGPDADVDSMNTRGPRGYDELNQARKAGYFGWPLFVGNNYPYHQYDYATGKSGPSFDPLKPVNDSRNNTGLRELPPVAPAFIWYPYRASNEFPQVGTGGRNAMAGPVYYTDMFPKETRLPDYYNGKVIIYDWIRGWIKAVTLLPNGDFDKLEPCFPGIKVNSLIDMETGPDGKLYLLEYGTGWFTQNPDAGLARIDYNGGNRPPKISSMKVDKASGVLPFAIRASIDAVDHEQDKITFVWDLGNGTQKETSVPSLDYTYTAAGDFAISVEVKDAKGASVKSNAVAVYAGNEIPQVTIQMTEGNRSFYLPGYPVRYSVTVNDPQDSNKFDPANLFVSADYEEGFDKAGSSQGHQQAAGGKAIMLSLDCKSCHKENEKSIGPSFTSVAEKYRNVPKASVYLTKKIIGGGKGVWGEVAMPPHSSLELTDVQQVVAWISSLAGREKKTSLAKAGVIIPPSNLKPNSVLVLSASYTDHGGNNIKALTGTSQLTLSGNTVSFTGKEEAKGFGRNRISGHSVLSFPATEGWFASDAIDLKGVNSVNILVGWRNTPLSSLDFEVRLDAPDGKMLGKGGLSPKGGEHGGVAHMVLEGPNDSQLHRLYFVYRPKGPTEAEVTAIQFGSGR